MVLDASAIVEVLLRTPSGQAIETRMDAAREPHSVPHLADLEVLQVFRRIALARQMTEERCAQALADWSQFPVTRYPHFPLADRIWELRANFGAYDAAYVALAEALQVPVLTHDAKLARSSGHGAVIELI